MAYARSLSIDPSGEWSPAQLKAVLSIIRPEAEDIGLKLQPIDVTTQSMPVKRFIILVKCAKHGFPIPVGAVCEMCLHAETCSDCSW